MEEDVQCASAEEMEEMIEEVMAEEMSEARDVIQRINAEHEISDRLKTMCMGLWDIYNTKSQELDEVGGRHDGSRIQRMQNHVRDHWSRQDIMEYHMGNMSDNGTIKWSLRHAPNKIAAISHYVSEDENAVPQTIEQANDMLDRVKSILAASGKDEVMFAYIVNDYNYWNNLSDEELYGI